MLEALKNKMDSGEFSIIGEYSSQSYMTSSQGWFIGHSSVETRWPKRSHSTVWETIFTVKFEVFGGATPLAFKERGRLSPSLASQDKSVHLILTLNKNSISSPLECKTVNLSEICSFHYVKRSTHYNQDKRMRIRQIDHHFKCINQLATLVTSQNRTARRFFCLSCVLEPIPGGHRISELP